MKLARAVPILTVDDVQTATARFHALLGVDVLMDLGWIATLGNPGSAPQFSVMEHDLTAAVNPTASLEVEDVDAAYRAALDAGLEIVHPLTDEEWGVRRFFVRDPGGSVLNILSHRR